MDPVRRHGVTVPLPMLELTDHRAAYEQLVALGFTDVWSGEANAHDGFTPLALAAAWQPSLRVGVAIAPAFTRGPALLAQTAATMSDAAPGGFVLGLGASSPAIVQQWNGIPFEEPFRRTRDVLRFVRRALTGEKVTERYDTFSIDGFRLLAPPKVRPKLMVAALRPGMLELAGTEGDGAILNWLSAADVAQVAPYVGGKEIMARIFVVPSDDFDKVRAIGARNLAAYLTVPAYRAFHEWLGRGAALQPMWDAWEAGDRARALEVIPDEVIDELYVWGDAARIRAGIEAYCTNGVHTPAPAIMGAGDAMWDAIRAIAPGAPSA